MSNIYITEPATNGKIIMSTTVGDIEIELWAKETPVACRNFVQLCMEGYYDDAPFHRIVKGFIVQGGDPSGTGDGGESVYGAPFKTESHSRLLFNRRGLLGMACPEANSNGSQFFFTLGEAMELNGKHTLFGRVVGNTLFNMLRLADVDVTNGDRPTRLHRVLKTTVVLNPYDDIIPRQSSSKKNKKNTVEEEIKSTAIAAKNYSLLSFGTEAEEDEVVVAKLEKELRARGKSAHERCADDVRLSKEMVAVSHEEDAKATKATSIALEQEAMERRRRRELAARLETEEEVLSRQKKMGELRAEAEAIRRDIARTLKAAKQREKAGATATEVREASVEAMAPAVPSTDTPSVVDQFADEVASYRAKSKKNKEQKNREELTMNLLSRFESQLSKALRVPTNCNRNGVDDASETLAVTPGDPNLWLRCKLLSEEADTSMPRRVTDPSLEHPDRHDLYDPRNPLNVRKRGTATNVDTAPHKRKL